MHTQQERPWPAIDLAELRFGIAFGSSVEELADSSMFLIRKGEVKIGAPSVDGHNTVFDVLGEGQIFGEIALLDGRPRSTDATAMTGCEFFVIDRRDFLPLLRGDPLIALGLIEMLCARLRRTSEQVEYVMFHQLSSRLANALLRLAEGASDMREHKINVTQRDLGDIIGMSRESTNKQLRDWERKKLVRRERGGIVILSTQTLALIAEGDFGSDVGIATRCARNDDLDRFRRQRPCGRAGQSG